MSVATSIVPPVSRLVATDLLQLIGHTPLIRLEHLAREFPGIEIYGKAEFFNPGGSVKDRAGAEHDPGRRAHRQADARPQSFWTPPAATPASPTP